MCVTGPKEQKGPVSASGTLPGKIQRSHVFVQEQNIFKGQNLENKVKTNEGQQTYQL